MTAGELAADNGTTGDATTVKATPTDAAAGERVAYQGEAGAFSEEALLTLLPRSVPVPHRTFQDVVAAVTSGSAAGGLLPVENTLAGGVAASFDALRAGRVHAVAEVVIPIRHFLMGPPGCTEAALRQVRSHPVALAQCQAFFRAHPQVAGIAVHDTAGAAREVAGEGDPSVAAIAPLGAAARYGLEVVARDLQDRDDNQTRFLLVRPGAWDEIEGPGGTPSPIGDPHANGDAHPAPGVLKTALVAETENRPGALHHLLGIFAHRGLDLTFIESRPAGTPWTYRFILEFRHASREEAKACLEETRGAARTLDVLGTFPAFRGPSGR